MVAVYDYVLILKNTSQKSIDRVSVGLLILSAFIFLIAGVFELISNINSTIILQHSFFNALFFTPIFEILLAVLIILFVKWDRKKFVKGLKTHYQFALLMTALGWFLLPHTGGIVFLFALIVVIEKPLKAPTELAFSKDTIVYTSPKFADSFFLGSLLNHWCSKKYTWSRLNHIVLKNGLVTLDFKNGSLVQKTIVGVTTATIEQEFNAFAQEQFATAKSLNTN